MEISKEINGTTCTIRMRGKFTFSDHQTLRSITSELEKLQIKSLVFDLSGVEFVDSAALGMLLLAREETNKKNIGLVLRGAQGQVKKMFQVSKFDSLFTIE